jgi:hypothetical protein
MPAPEKELLWHLSEKSSDHDEKVHPGQFFLPVAVGATPPSGA